MIYKTPFSHEIPFLVFSQKRGGAFLLSLCFLGLIVFIVLSFFSAVHFDAKTTKLYVDAGSAHQLGDSVVKLVMGQISEAASGERTAWASQPGMIRTWSSSGRGGKIFKLYSSDIMVENGEGFNSTKDAKELGTWKLEGHSFNALWCDLNSPVRVTEAEDKRKSSLVYPILTPPSSLDSENGVTVDASYQEVPKGIQGYSVKESPGYSSQSISPANHPVPMPVKWLYVLRDGELVAPQGGVEKVVIREASEKNPIVGRIAFWTDDETCKVNVNTASDGKHWQVPRSYGTPAIEMAKTPPGVNEYQRYPGHPASISLMGVLSGGLEKGSLSVEEILKIAPRVQSGGSLNGIQSPLTDNSKISLTGDMDRLYQSLTDLAYLPDRKPHPKITVEDVTKRSFFMTANSRASDLTLFETPRISLWPITQPKVKQDIADQRLMFASSLQGSSGSLPYYFQREKPLSPTHDWDNFKRNQELYQYLQRMTSSDHPMPGFGGSFQTKFGADRDQILTSMFDYIRSGPNLYGAGHAAAGDTSYLTKSYAKTDSLSESIFAGYYLGCYSVVPIKVNDTKGFGNTHGCISQVGIGFYCEGIDLNYTDGAVPVGHVRYKIRAVPLISLFRPMNGWDGYNAGPAAQSSGSDVHGVWVRIASTTGGIITSSTATSAVNTSINFPINDPVIMSRTAPEYYGKAFTSPMAFFLHNDYTNGGNYNNTGVGTGSTRLQLTYGNNIFRSLNTTDLTFDITAAPPYSLTTGLDFPSPLTNGNAPSPAGRYNTQNDARLRFNFSSMNLKIQILTDDRLTVVQEADVTIPSGTYAVPFWNYGSVTYATQPTPTISGTVPNFQVFNTLRFDFRLRSFSSFTMGGNNYPNVRKYFPLGVFGDVIQSRELQGDYRVMSLQQNLVDSQFATPTALNPTLTSNKLQHAFETYSGSAFLSPSRGLLVPGIATYTRTSGPPSAIASRQPLEIPGCPSSLNGAFMFNGAPGDWDNGYGASGDGAYINPPDPSAIGLNSNSTINETSYGYFNLMFGLSASDNVKQFSALYSPYRQMYSAFQFGSLPSRAKALSHWETLLFCPNPAATRNLHRGYTEFPRDHLFADFFTMPIMEPYSLSDSFSTAGKVNLNYEIQPFLHIQRTSAVAAALRNLKITAFDEKIANNQAVYKSGNPNGGQPLNTHRNDYLYSLNIEETLKGFSERFANQGIFKSATEIAEMFLVPQGSTQAGVEAWWTDKRLTGDNSRELPYSYLLPRVTTKSNTYTVHYRVQALQKRRTSNPQEWDEKNDPVLSEYRGSALIERFLDPEDSRIQKIDFATDSSLPSLAPYYRWKVIQKRQFVP